MSGGTALLHDAARGRVRPLDEARRSAWSGILWHWSRRIGAPVVLEAASRIGAQTRHLDDEGARRAIVAELVRIARTKTSRPPAERKRAALARAVAKAEKLAAKQVRIDAASRTG